MTGYPSTDNAIETLKSGVVDFLTKPINIEQLPLIIERVMRERALFVDNILLKEEAKKNEKLLMINEELKQKIKELETMNLILQKLDQVATSKDLFQTLVNVAGEVTICDEAHLYLPKKEGKNPWARWHERLPSSYFERRWGAAWQDTDKEFWGTFRKSIKARPSPSKKEDP